MSRNNLKIVLSFILLVLPLAGKAAQRYEEPEDTIPNLSLNGVNTVEIQGIPDSLINQEIQLAEETVESNEFSISLPENFNWEVASIQGKLKMKGLPLSPTIKIFLKKDSLIDISVRAPFVGEAGRLEMTRDSITAINKMNKTYVNESIAELLQFYPGGLGNIQDLLLGKFFLPGMDVNEVDLDEVVDIFYEDNQINVVPKGAAEIEGIKYGFVVDEFFNPLMLAVFPLRRPDIEVYAIYNYKLQGYDLQFIVKEGSREIEATFEMKEPEWDGERPKMIKIDKKYRKMNFSDFITAVG